MPDQITTVVTPDDLPVGSVVMTEAIDGKLERRVWMRHGGGDSGLLHDWQSTDGGFQRMGAESHARDLWALNRRVIVLYRPDAAPVEPHTLPTEAEAAQVVRDAVLNYDPSEGDEVPSMAARAILAMFDSRYTYGVWTRHDGQKVPYREDALALDPDEALRFHSFPAECGCYPLNTDNREWACEHGATWTRGSMEPYGKPTTGPIYPYGGISGHGIVTRIDCPESECPTCTEEDPNA